VNLLNLMVATITIANTLDLAPDWSLLLLELSAWNQNRAIRDSWSSLFMLSKVYPAVGLSDLCTDPQHAAPFIMRSIKIAPG
jgi:hypothetical protein